MNTADPIVIVSIARTPMGNFSGGFSDTPATTLGAAAIKAVVERAAIEPDQIDAALMGCVLPAGLGQAPARQAALSAGLSKSCVSTTVNKMCGSGMQTVILAHDSLLAGSHDIIVAGGMENMTRAPYLIPNARLGYRIGHAQIFDHMMLDGLEDAYDKGRSMGTFAEDCAEKYHFSREQQDEFALASVDRAVLAAKQGLFNNEITPITVKQRRKDVSITADEGPANVRPEKIPQLKPAFKKDGTVTAANASSISDGAAALLLMRQSKAKALNLTPLARIVAHSAHANEPSWFTTAPVGALQKVLKKTGWSVEQVDLFEINEAFAVVPMAAMRELNIPHDKVNVHGGACVLGHPIGASGARILVTLINALTQKQGARGIATLCIGGGEATAIAIEME